MSKLLNPLIQRFAERTPIPVMARAIMERCLQAQSLDEWFAQASEGQYTRELLFSTVFELISQVVFRHQPSLHAAYQGTVEQIGVSVTSVYNKINGLAPGVSAGLVRHAATQGTALIEAMKASSAPLLPGYRVKILDGNKLGGCERRLAETRESTAAPLPGQSLVVLDPVLGLITDLFPCTDAYTQERALLGAVIDTVKAGELWIADRNFCTVGFLQALTDRGAAGLIREHEQVPFVPLEPMHECGRIRTGRVGEQTVEIPATTTRPALRLRRIRLHLDQPTRQGETRVYLLTTVPAAAASARRIARLYAQRWRIETAFQQLTVDLRCEINTLGYPQAALFGFASAVVAFNVMAVVRAALRAVHGGATIEQDISSYYLANDIAKMAESLATILDPQDWAVFQDLSMPLLAAWLLDTARHVQLRKYRKHPRGPKKPKPKRPHAPQQPHVSTARPLAKRKVKSAP